MAQSFSHRWGQIIGDLIESTILELLQAVADEFKLYLDYQKARKTRRGRKVAWKDRYGNTHDLDYVLERGGTETVVGVPAAFVEIAWRRYTKHSRNKAQEIEGAIVPLADTYSHLHPFLGIVLAGVFTKGSINQLRSRGFSLVYFPYESVLKAFSAVGIDAAFGEETPESEFRRKVAQRRRLPTTQLARVKSKLLQAEKAQIDRFFQELRRSLSRQVVGITVSVLHGEPREVPSVQDAITYIERYRVDGANQPILKYELHVRYNNGDTISAVFDGKKEAVSFLKTFS